MKTRLLFLSLLSSFSLTLSSAQAWIIGGDLVSSDDQEAKTTVALLTITPQGVGTCTASIIAKDLLVTAAHCVTDEFGRVYVGQRLRIVFNKSIEDGIDGNRVSVAARVPAGWKGMFSSGKDQSDIAVVHFKGGLPNGFKPAVLLPASRPLQNGQTVTLAGYGVTQMDPSGGSGSGILRKVDVKISNAKFAKTEVLLDQRQGRGACHGDSGGPAEIVRNGVKYLWGVTNRGYPETGPDDCAQFSIYTRITAHQSFINTAAAQLRALP